MGRRGGAAGGAEGGMRGGMLGAALRQMEDPIWRGQRPKGRVEDLVLPVCCWLGHQGQPKKASRCGGMEMMPEEKMLERWSRSKWKSLALADVARLMESQCHSSQQAGLPELGRTQGVGPEVKVKS